ncbi:MAG: hypothetical protein MZV65_36545 [Chromatiales bacterium]|nr:hypothetical protein [Chromatiales bacterium]
MACRRRCRSEAERARPAGVRRHLPAGDQGARGGRRACARRAARSILIGHAGHPEVEGTMGQYDDSQGGDVSGGDGRGCRALRGARSRPNWPTSPRPRCRWTTRRGSSPRCASASRPFEGPSKDDICYATQNRQDAVKELARRCDVVLVVGSRNSSNSNRLRELAENEGAPAYLIDGAGRHRAEPGWRARPRIGVTAGASAPEVLVQQVIDRLRELGATPGHGKRWAGGKRGVRVAEGVAVTRRMGDKTTCTCSNRGSPPATLGGRLT